MESILDTMDTPSMVDLAFRLGLDEYLSEKFGNWDDCELGEEAQEFLIQYHGY